MKFTNANSPNNTIRVNVFLETLLRTLLLRTCLSSENDEVIKISKDNDVTGTRNCCMIHFRTRSVYLLCRR